MGTSHRPHSRSMLPPPESSPHGTDLPGTGAHVVRLWRSGDGQRALATDYWTTPQARRGLPWLSWREGTLRVLVPPASERLLGELPPPGTPVTYVERPATRLLVYEDNPERPYAVEVDARQCDHVFLPGDDGRTFPLLWYVRDGEDGARLVREEEVTVRVAPRSAQPGTPKALVTPACTLQVFGVDDSATPVAIPADLYPELFRVLTRDPEAEWLPKPAGGHGAAARAAGLPGTGPPHCLLVVPSSVSAVVRIAWVGDSPVLALQSIEDAFWHAVPRDFVFATLVALKLGRACKGFEGPVASAVVPWSSEVAPRQPPPPLSRKSLDELLSGCLRRLGRHEAVAVPERGTDAYRFLVRLGSMLWREDNARHLAGVYSGATGPPEVMACAIGLHAMLHHPVEVEIGGVRVRAADPSSGRKLWGQWAEWMLRDAPPGFLMWIFPDGLYRASRMLEPGDADIPDPSICGDLERALIEDAGKNARYVPYGAFTLEVQEELFLHRWGVRWLWLWVEGRRVWCAVAGEDGVPRESFCWEAGRGVLFSMVVPRSVAPALSAVLAAAWRDMVVAGEEVMPAGRHGEASHFRGTGAPSGPPPPLDRPAVFPRCRTPVGRTLAIGGHRLWGPVRTARPRGAPTPSGAT